MFACDTSKEARPEARGEGRERGNLHQTTVKPPDTQRAGGLHIDIYIYGHVCRFGGSARRALAISSHLQLAYRGGHGLRNIHHIETSMTRCGTHIKWYKML